MSNNNFIGRTKEQAVLQTALASQEPEMVAVIGRHRVGKTFLIKNTYSDRIAFEVTGIQNGPLSEQLQSFAFKINKTFYEGKAKLKPKNWLEAFQNIGNVFFSPSGTLSNEFQNLYPALFENSANHSAVIRVLSQKWKGMRRKEILEITGLPNGGTLTDVIQELLYSGFISQY